MKIKINDIVNLMCSNNFFAYIQVGYTFNDLDNLNSIINRIIQEEEVLHIELHDAMENYAKIYELFKPKRIMHDDYLWGTVHFLDGIYSTLYDYMEICPTRLISKSYPYSFITPYKKRVKTLIDNVTVSSSDLRDMNLDFISLQLKKTIGQKAVELYLALEDCENYYIEEYIKLYIKLLSNLKSIDIEFIKGSEKKIKVNSKIIKVESELTFRDEILNLT